MWEQINGLVLQSSNRIKSGIVNFLPGLLALIVILLITIIVTVIVRIALRRFLRSVDFDGIVGRLGFPELAAWSPKHSPSLMAIRIVNWWIILVGLLIGINALDASLTSMLVVRLFDYIPHVIAAVIVLAVGTFAARFLARSVLISAVNLKIHSARLISLGVKWMVMILTAAMALEQLGIGGQIVTISFAILFGGIVLALALALGLGSKDMVSRSWEKQDRGEETKDDGLQHL
jgi:Mechanosensitive ion channel, conserved TM helix